MSAENIQALMTLKDVISHRDGFGNIRYDFPALIRYTYWDKVITEPHTCKIINITGHETIALQIVTESNEINDHKLYTVFSADYGRFTFNARQKILIIQQETSPKIGRHTVKVELL